MESAKASEKNEDSRTLSDLALDVVAMAVIVIAVAELVFIYGWRG